MRKHRYIFFVFVIAGALATFATASIAVQAFLDADRWADASKDYRLGYAAGALDMLRALDDAKFITSSVAKRTHSIVECSNDETDSAIGKIYETYISNEPSRRSHSTTSAIYNAIRIHCGIN